MRRFILLEKHHAVFAERDEEILRLPFFEQCFARALKVDILGWRFIRIAPGNTSREKGFGAIRLHHRHSVPIDRMSRIRISRYDLSGGARVTCNWRNEFRCQEAFTVIFKDDRVGFRKFVSNRGDDSCDLGGRRADKLLTINTNDLLMAGDDAGFDDGAKRLVLDRIGDVDLFISQQVAKLLPAAVFSEQADHRNALDKLAEITRNIGGASRKK